MDGKVSARTVRDCNLMMLALACAEPCRLRAAHPSRVSLWPSVPSVPFPYIYIDAPSSLPFLAHRRPCVVLFSPASARPAGALRAWRATPPSARSCSSASAPAGPSPTRCSATWAPSWRACPRGCCCRRTRSWPARRLSPSCCSRAGRARRCEARARRSLSSSGCFGCSTRSCWAARSLAAWPGR